jgi:hypothetical protein
VTENIEHKVDRTGWPRGAWDGEPDRVEWRAHGFPCLIVRNRSGALCGYVGLPPGHALHGRDYSDDLARGLEAHGGLTYAAACAGHICHVPQPGEPDAVWWLGFDCSHSWDIAPGTIKFWRDRGYPDVCSDTFSASYKPVHYVTAEVEHLASQLAEVAK